MPLLCCHGSSESVEPVFQHIETHDHSTYYTLPSRSTHTGGTVGTRPPKASLGRPSAVSGSSQAQKKYSSTVSPSTSNQPRAVSQNKTDDATRPSTQTSTSKRPILPNTFGIDLSTPLAEQPDSHFTPAGTPIALNIAPPPKGVKCHQCKRFSHAGNISSLCNRCDEFYHNCLRPGHVTLRCPSRSARRQSPP